MRFILLIAVTSLTSTFAFAGDRNNLDVSINCGDMSTEPGAWIDVKPYVLRQAEKVINAIHKSEKITQLIGGCRIPVGLVVQEQMFVVTSEPRVAGGGTHPEVVDFFTASITNYGSKLSVKGFKECSKKGIVNAAIEALQSACGDTSDAATSSDSDSQ
jgi:hypothetical protein